MTSELEKVGLRVEVVDINFQAQLEKHLGENEVICTDCGGSGMKIENNPFGIQGYNHPRGHYFPFQNQAISFCQSCYNGVRKVCPHCNELLRRTSNICDCQGYKENQEKLEQEREQAEWDKAEKIPLDEALTQFGMFYVPDYDEFVETDRFEEWLNTKAGDLEEGEEFDPSTLKIYGTKVHVLSLDASSILETATEDLHEEAYSNINKTAVKELQDFLTTWCEKNSKGSTTYYADFTKAVVL